MSIQVDNITYTYMPKSPYESQALKGISVTIEKGEFVAIIGHTGSGKSTLAEHLNGLLAPTTGQVKVDDVNLNVKGPAVKAAKCKVGMVFQYPEHQLFGETIAEDIAFGPKNLGLSDTEVTARVQKAMQFVDLPYEEFAQRSPFQLSGGQMRRVAIAGVVAMEPDYLILDEPTAGLDPLTRNNIFGQLQKLYAKRNMAVVLITHSMEEAATYADRLLVMSKGKLILDGKPQDIFVNSRATLQEAGLDVPATVKLADLLRDRGLLVKGNPLTMQDLVQTIKTAKGWS